MKEISPKEIQEILLHFSNSIQGIKDENELLWDLVHNCISILGLEDAVVYLVDESGERLEQKAAFGIKNPKEKEILNPIKISFGEGVTGKVAQNGIPIIIKDNSKNPDYIKDVKFMKSEIAVPLMLEGKVIGVIDSENSQAAYFGQQHLQIFLAIASIYSGQIARIRAERHSEKILKEKLEIEKKANNLQMQAISAQLSPHFVFNSLNAVQHFIVLEDKTRSLKFLNLFGKLLRYFLTTIQQEQIEVNREIQMLNWYLEIQSMRYREKFKYKLDHKGLDDFPNAQIPGIIVQSLVENLLESHIYKSDGNLKINIDFRIFKDEVLMNVAMENPDNKSIRVKNKEYTSSLPPWEEYVKLLNDIRPYTIKTNVREKSPASGLMQFKIIEITFPNLG
ncbi:histidine kinase [Algoriphagus sediminis]|uniref:Histidine kinase n=1 Tax=Algoriphagus sediminis TaxID=3057113 RepID=A0ABT7YC36_9BACT|nr:histidine kinase [Algoriphagus sediminis]MDN3203744.1 histidine kinase [Algoriphagus sediminis]